MRLRRQELFCLLALLIVAAPLAMQRCGIGLDTDKTLKVTYFGASNGPSPVVSATSSVGSQPDDLSPAKIANLRLWYKAESFDPSYPDGAVIPVNGTWLNSATSDGSPILVSTSGGQTFLKTAGPKSKPVVRFNNTSYFSAGAAFDSASTGLTLFAVGKKTAGNTGGFIGLSTTGTFSYATDDFVRMNGPANTLHLEVAKSPSFAQNNASIAIDSNNHIFFGIWNPASVGTEIYMFGSQLGSTTQALTPTVNTLNLSGTVALGWGGTYFDGDIAEVIAYTRALNATEQAYVNSYLTAKYGL